MPRSQFIFSLISGLLIMGAGHSLAQQMIADWGLFWVGLGISLLTLVSKLQSIMDRQELGIPALQALPIRADN